MAIVRKVEYNRRGNVCHIGQRWLDRTPNRTILARPLEYGPICSKNSW